MASFLLLTAVLLALPQLICGLVYPCSYVAPSGVRFDDLLLLKQPFGALDYTWSGYSSSNAGVLNVADPWQIGVNICSESASNAACRNQWGSICLYNQTSISSHPVNVSLPGDLLVGGRESFEPIPFFRLIDDDNEEAGVVMTYHNGLPRDSPLLTTLYLHCDSTLLGSDNRTSAVFIPSALSLGFHLTSAYACPTYWPPGPFRLTGWMIFLILLSSLIVAYVVIGCLWNALVKGTPQGWASFPHRDMWRKLPGRVARATTFAWVYLRNGCKTEAEVYTEL
jgi:hypothetical protein